MNSKILKSNKGDTLLEIIVALAIMTLMGLSFFSVLNRTMLNNMKNERDTKMLNIAQTEVESLTKSVKEGSTSITKKRKRPIDEDTYQLVNRKFDITKAGKISYDVEDDEKTIYICNLSIKDIKLDKKANKIAYLYDIEIEVSPEDKKFTKRKVELNTKILSSYK